MTHAWDHAGAAAVTIARFTPSLASVSPAASISTRSNTFRSGSSPCGPLAIGDLLDASHRSMRDDFEISVPELDLAVETARENGAVGARMTGGGFGGSAIALIDRDAVPAVREAMLAAFAAAGHIEPHVFTVRPSEGARHDG